MMSWGPKKMPLQPAVVFTTAGPQSSGGGAFVTLSYSSCSTLFGLVGGQANSSVALSEMEFPMWYTRETAKYVRIGSGMLLLPELVELGSRLTRTSTFQLQLPRVPLRQAVSPDDVAAYVMKFGAEIFPPHTGLPSAPTVDAV